MSYEWRRGAYHTFRQGSLSATCKPTPAYADVAPKFMPHHAQQMQSFTPGQAPPPEGTYVVQEAPTYLLARDEDCENLFHSMADHVRAQFGGVIHCVGGRIRKRGHPYVRWCEH
jgi:hypothetical protein